MTKDSGFKKLVITAEKFTLQVTKQDDEWYVSGYKAMGGEEGMPTLKELIHELENTKLLISDL